MIRKDMRANARNIGVNVKNHSRLGMTDLIRAIQEKEKIALCYQNISDCWRFACLGRPDCQN